MKSIDYTRKCGTCVHFERDGERRAGWCHKDAYNATVVHDPRHPYRVRSMSNSCRYYFDARPTNADRIRAMRDEELADFILKKAQSFTNSDFCIVECDRVCSCSECVVNWLQQHVEEETP